MSGIVKSALSLFGIKKEKDVEGVSIENFLETLPDLLGYDIKFKQEERENVLAHFEIEGNETDEFLKKNSNILEALSHLSMRLLRRQAGVANSALENDTDIKKFRVTFDSDGYREKKIENLKDLAEKARQKVIDAGGKPSYLPALSPSERKVVHTKLAELGEVTSESIGKGTFKRIRVKLVTDSKFRKKRDDSDRERPNNNRSQNKSGGQRRGNNNRRGNQDKPYFPSDSQPKANGGGFSFVNDPFGVSSDKPEVNGNVAVSEVEEKVIDDSIGNKLAPGEGRFDSNNE